jgi:hypothetical protein
VDDDQRGRCERARREKKVGGKDERVEEMTAREKKRRREGKEHPTGIALSPSLNHRRTHTHIYSSLSLFSTQKITVKQESIPQLLYAQLSQTLAPQMGVAAARREREWI